MILPWHNEQWQWFLRAKDAQRLPHALLLTGMGGLGKKIFADYLTRALLCNQKELAECTCQTCGLIKNRSHPNVLWVEPEKPGQAIKVDQIRFVAEFIQQSALQNGYRIVVISSANDMNINAANALLKTLEEPTADAMLILISNQSSQLPATILSRCQRLVFLKPKKDEVLPWLKTQLQDGSLSAELLLNLAHGAPLVALELADPANLLERQTIFKMLFDLQKKQMDPLTAVVKIQEIDTIKLLDYILGWLIDVLRLQLGGDQIINSDFATELFALKQQTQLENNSKLLNHLQITRKQICQGFNLNKQLMLETIFIKWCA